MLQLKVRRKKVLRKVLTNKFCCAILYSVISKELQQDRVYKCQPTGFIICKMTAIKLDKNSNGIVMPIKDKTELPTPEYI